MAADPDWTPPRASPTNLDGSPRGKPGPPKGTRVGGRRPATPSAPPKTAPRAPSAARAKTDYRPGLRSMGSLIAGFIGMIGARTDSLATVADAAAVHIHTEPLAEGLQQVADQDPKVAAALDRILKAGPYAAILAPVIGLGMQIAVNHRWVPIELGEQMGAMTPEELIDRVAGEPPRPAPAPPAPEQAPPVPTYVPDPVV